MEVRDRWGALFAVVSLLTAITAVALLAVIYFDDDSQISAQYSSQIALNSKIIVLDISENPEPVVYEIPESQSQLGFIKSRIARNELNAKRYQDASKEENELMQDRKKSENWSTFVNDELVQGYDVIRMERGDFADKVEPKREVSSRAALARGYY